MSKWYVITTTGYRLTDNPPNHNHWTYDKKEDNYYEVNPIYNRTINDVLKKGIDNDNRKDS